MLIHLKMSQVELLMEGTDQYAKFLCKLIGAEGAEPMLELEKLIAELFEDDFEDNVKSFYWGSMSSYFPYNDCYGNPSDVGAELHILVDDAYFNEVFRALNQDMNPIFDIISGAVLMLKGAFRGMWSRLNDIECRFMTKHQESLEKEYNAMAEAEAEAISDKDLIQE